MLTVILCLDHFLESDTDLHSWESLVTILEDPICADIILEIGMPVMVNFRSILTLLFYRRPLGTNGNY